MWWKWVRIMRHFEFWQHLLPITSQLLWFNPVFCKTAVPSQKALQIPTCILPFLLNTSESNWPELRTDLGVFIVQTLLHWLTSKCWELCGHCFNWHFLLFLRASPTSWSSWEKSQDYHQILRRVSNKRLDLPKRAIWHWKIWRWLLSHFLSWWLEECDTQWPQT